MPVSHAFLGLGPWRWRWRWRYGRSVHIFRACLSHLPAMAELAGGPFPESIGPYHITGLLGRGGMGIVYRAIQLEPVRRELALKVLQPHLAQPNLVARFAAERQALALMSHPGIARVYDAGTAEDGRPYFAMELVTGPPITEYADTHRLQLEDRIRLFARCCRAVHHAHQKGVIHRDLKPSNVLVGEEEGMPFPKVIDFGVAKAIGVRLTDETLLTRFGQAIGTPAYMSPEQADPANLDIDTRTDIYSLGVILYELLTGCLPFDPKECGPGRFLAVLQDAETASPPPSARFTTLDAEAQQARAALRSTEPGRLRERLRGDLDWVVMKALEKNRTRRYDSARALAREIERVLRHEPVQARPPSAAYRFRKFVRRHRVGVAAASVVLLALVAGTIAAGVGFVRAAREARTAKQVSDFMTSVFTADDPSNSRGAETTVREVLDRAAGKIETELAGEPLVQGRLMEQIGGTYRSLGLLDPAYRMTEGAMERLQQGGARPLEIAAVQHDLGYLLIFRTEYARAESLLRASLATRRRLLGDGAAETAQSLNNLVFLFLRSQTHVAEGERLLRDALPDIRARLGPRDEQVALTMYHQCWALQSLGRLVEADSTCGDVVALRREIYGGDHPQIEYALLQLSHARAALGRYAGALEAAHEALAMSRRLYPADHSETAYSLMATSAAWLGLGQPDSALPYAMDAEAMLGRMLDQDNTERSPALRRLADVLTALRRFDQAGGLYRNAFVLDSGKFGNDHPQIVWDLDGLGAMHLERSRFREAAAYDARALAIARRLTGHAPTLLAALLAAGEADGRTGDLARARTELQEALDSTSRSPADHPLQRAAAEVQLARVLTAMDRTDEACPLAAAGLAASRAILGPGHWKTGVAMTVLGRCDVRSGQTTLGERLLSDARALLRRTLPPGNLYRRDTAIASTPALLHASREGS